MREYDVRYVVGRGSRAVARVRAQSEAEAVRKLDRLPLATVIGVTEVYHAPAVDSQRLH